jgi:prepilin-type N-terminal cleavage/methylation domain-containing protein
MKSIPSSPRVAAGFTLVEMLVVISIIAILAGILLPVIARAKTKTKIAQTRLEMGQIKNAISSYETEYGFLPGSQNALGTGTPDFTFGNMGAVTATSFVVSNYNHNTSTLGAYQANNSELVAILMDLETFRNGATTVNNGHARNPRRLASLQGKEVNGGAPESRPGIGSDGVFRDAFGNPYIVTIDVDADGIVYDPFYRLQAVSQENGQTGYNGLHNSQTPAGNSDFFAIRDKVAIWTFGPDRLAAPRDDGNNPIKANTQGTLSGQKIDNNDNILSWK